MKSAIVVFVLVTLAVSLYAAENITEENAVNKEKKAEAKTRLFKHLFKNYNPEIIPDSPAVKFGVALITANLVEVSSILDTNLWTRLVWNDSRLTWNEKDFGGVSVLRVQASNVWIPDITLYNAADTRHGNFDASCGKTNILIYSNGQVLWVPPCRYLSRCATNSLFQNPTEQVTCTLKFGSWTYDALTMGVSLYNDKNFVDMTDFDDITPWKVLSAPGEIVTRKYPCCEEPYATINYNITLQRKPTPTVLVQ